MSALDFDALKKFPPDGCDIYAWEHYVKPLVSRVEHDRAALRKANQRANEWASLAKDLNEFCRKAGVGLPIDLQQRFSGS